MDRVQQRKQLTGPISVAEHRKRDHRPDGGVRVLSTVLSNAGRVALDVSGVERCPIEGWREEQDQPSSRRTSCRSTAAIAAAACAFPRPRRARSTTARSNQSDTRRSMPHRAAFHRRNRLAGTSRRPSRPARGIARARRCAAARMRRALLLAAAIRQPSEGRQRGMKKPAEPDALALAATPTRFRPSFQSPVPIRGGRGCRPQDWCRGRARSVRTACPARVTSSAESTIPARRLEQWRPSRNGTASSRMPTSPVTSTY